MMDAKLALIKANKLKGLAEKLKECSTDEHLQVLRYSSRCAFDSNDVRPDLLAIVTQACDGLASAASFNLVTYYKSLYYVVQVAAKKDDFYSALQLLSYLSSHISKCYNNTDTSTFIKSLYQIAWNLSLRSPDAIVALKLQRHALIFLLTAAPDSISKVVSLVTMTASNFTKKCKEQSTDQMNGTMNKSVRKHESSPCESKNDYEAQLLSFYHQILLAVFAHVSLSKILIPSDIVEIITLLSSCKIHEHPNILKYSLKTFKSLCGQVCYSAVYTGLQTLLSALKVRHCSAPVADLEAAVGVVRQYHETIIVDAGARQVALQCLLSALDALEDVDSQDTTYVPVSILGLDQILSLVLSYITPDAEVSIKLKVVGSMQRWCRTLVSQLSHETSTSMDSGSEIMHKAASWSARAESSLQVLLPLSAETAAHYHNLGVTCGNLGVLCYRAGDYTSSAACLSACVALQDLYCTAQPQQLSFLSSSVHKKRSLLCDAHRYCENFSAAASVLALQVLHLAAESTLPGTSSLEVPYDAIFSVWFKLKKEAVKANSSVLQGVVLWTLVQGEVVRHPSLRPTGDLQVQLLTREFGAAAASVVPGLDCSAEQLQCAQLLHTAALAQLRVAAAAPAALQLVVRALLMCAQVVYFKTDVCIPKTFSPASLRTETLRACCPDEGESVPESECCSWAPQEGCPALYLLSFALSICDTVSSVPPFDPARLIKSTRLQNGNTCSKLASKKSQKLTQVTHDTAERPKNSDSTNCGVSEASAEASVPAEWLETCADLHFWLMVALQQQQQQQQQKMCKKQDAASPAVPASLTATAADLGDEQQPDDVCDVRSNTAALLRNPLLLHGAAHLQQALHCWHLMMVGDVAPAAPTVACRAIAAVGHFCTLHGRSVPAVLSWKLLLHFSTRTALHSYKLKACCELIWSCPELVDGSVAEEVEAELGTVGRHDTNTAVLARVTLAYYHLCRGQQREGWLALQAVLRHEVVATKKTVRATEVQCLAHYTASLYSLLPPHVLGDHSPALNPVAVAQIAAREAIALTHTALDVPELHWPWRVSWLHQLTSAWLGRLALLTAQPRLARAYLKAPLAAAHEDVLPCRAAVAIALLAEVDLLCDQVEDCRVKVDTLLMLLSPRPPRSVQALDFSPPSERAVLTPSNLNKTRTTDATPLTTGSRITKTLRKLSARSGKENTFVGAVSASKPTVRIEAMRQALSSSGDNSPDDEENKGKFTMADAQNKLGTQWVAIKSRLKYLNLPSTKIDRYKLDGDRKTCPDSPSLGHRETALHLPVWRSPYEDKDDADAQESCVLDAYFPLLCDAYLSTGAMLTSYHRQGARWQAAQDTVDRVCAAYDQMQQDARRQCEVIAAILGTEADAERTTVFATNALIVGWCSAQRSAVQLLVARDRWTEALQLCNSAVSASAALPLQSMWRHHCHLLPLLLQARLLLNTHRHRTASTRDGTRALDVPLASPVACPTVGAVTPHHSPNLSQHPPPLHRAPRFYPQSPRQDCEDSFDSDETSVYEHSAGLVEGSDLFSVQQGSCTPDVKTRLVNGKQRQPRVELSDSDEDDTTASASACNSNQKSAAKACRSSSAIQDNSRVRAPARRTNQVLLPKIVVISESPEHEPDAVPAETDGDSSLLDVQKKLSEIVLNDQQSEDINSIKSCTSSSKSVKSGSRSQRANNSSLTVSTALARTRDCTSSKKTHVADDAADVSSNEMKKTAKKTTSAGHSGKENSVGPRTRGKKTCDNSSERSEKNAEVTEECPPITASVRRGRSRLLRPTS